MTKQFLASELTLDKNGNVYHLGLGPEDVADTVILVGDPDRVALVAAHFDSVRFENRNREFHTVTGVFRGCELTVLSTGIGTDNIDIVVTELDAAVNIDLATRQEKSVKRSLRLVRIGTCGALQEHIEPGTRVISNYAIGLDGIAHFYDSAYTPEEMQILTAFLHQSGWNKDFNQPYLKKAGKKIFETLKEGMTEGITITANGFYGPQGRAVRVPLREPDFKEKIRSFNWRGLPVANLEMETSGIYLLADALGHEAVTICLVLANRYTGKFEPDYAEKMDRLIRDVMARLVVHV
jgi:uridine phosphorylase